MKVLLFGLAAGSFALLGAEASPGDVVGTLGGAAGLGVSGLIFWMMKQHKDELKETREDFSRRETARDTMFNNTIKEIVTEFKQALRHTQDEFNRIHREMREENRAHIERQYKLTEEVVSSLEAVNQSLQGLSNRQQTLEEWVKDMRQLPSPEPFHQKPHYPPPGSTPPDPPSPRRPGR